MKRVISIAVALAAQSWLVAVEGRSVTEKLEVAAGNCRIEFIFEAQIFSEWKGESPKWLIFFAAYPQELAK